MRIKIKPGKEGDVLRWMRKESKSNQRVIAEAIGRKHPSIVNMEAGRQKVSDEALNAAALLIGARLEKHIVFDD